MNPEDQQFEPASPTAAPSPAPSETHGAAAGEAGVPSNTPCSNPTSSIVSCSGGEDWLELSLYLKHKNFSQLTERLDWARNESEATNKPVEVLIDDQAFLIKSGTAKVGVKGNELSYRWRLLSPNGWVLLLMRRPDPHPTMPTGIVRATSHALLRLGPHAFWEQAKAALADLQIDLVKNKLSRVDPCADLPSRTIDSLHGAFIRGDYVSRARSSSDHYVDECFDTYYTGRRPSGFDLGKGNTRLRVYDKLLKCKYDWEMLQLMQTRRWGGLPSDAIRIEFQLRRGKLKAFGVDTLADWYDKRGAICEQLITKWLRMTAGPVDSRHADRTETHPDWIQAQEAFKDWTGNQPAILAPLPTSPSPPDDRIKQVIGILKSFHAQSTRPIKDKEDFLTRSNTAIARVISDRDIANEVLERAIEMGVAWK